MPRIARITEIGFPHHVTQRGNNRQTIFLDDQDRDFYIDLLCLYSSECVCLIHAFCLMNNHIHILITPQAQHSLSKMMQKLSLTYSQYFNKKYNRTGHLWESRFYSGLIDRDSYLLSACRYIERNPVRAQLVKNPLDYEWSSVGVNTGVIVKSFIEPIWHWEQERKEYFEFLMRGDDSWEENRAQKIRKATYTGRPLGSEEFCQRIENTLGRKVTSGKIGTHPN